MKTLMRTIAIAALGLFAATNANAYTLEQDEDWSNRGSSFPETVDLNGHRLTVARLDACTITDSSEQGPGGELRINSATDVTKTDATKITGTLTLVKDGVGKLIWNGGTLAATIPILITNGVLKLGVTTANVFGNSGTVAVKGKGQFDLNYDPHGGTSPVYNKTFEIEGDGPDGSGAIVNTAGNVKSDWGYTLKTVVLTGDATIGGKAYICFNGSAGAFGVEGPDYTLTIKNTRKVSNCGGYLKVKRVVCCDGGLFQPADLAVAQVPEGVFLRSGGVFWPWSGAVDRELPFAVTVEAGETGSISCDGKSSKITKAFTVGAGAVFTLAAGQACTLADAVTNNGTIKSAGPALTITGTLRGNGTITGNDVAFGGNSSCWHVECNDAGFTEKVDLEAMSADFLVGLRGIDVLCGGSEAEKTFDLAPAGNLTQADAIALTVTDATSRLPLGASTLMIVNGRLVLNVVRDPRPVIAVWTGATGNGRLDDVGNWACTNASGKAVSSLPCGITDVHLNGETAIQIPADATFDVKSVIANMTLTNDCDWSGLTVPVDGGINLNGFNLTVTRLDGSCAITDTSAGGSGGELHLNCATDVNKTSTMTFSGSLTFVKDGEGTLTWAGGTIANTAPVLITNGVLKLGVTTANVFGNSGTVAVKGKGQFDLNYDTHGGTSPVYNKTFEIEGDGPDGSGAIVNTAGNAKSNWGYTLKEVVLTGDATIGGKAYICFNGTAGVFGVEGPDYTLTIKNTSIVSNCGGYLKVKRVVCCDGGLFQPADLAVAQAPEGVFLRSGGVFSPWSGAVDRELPLAVTVEAGETGSIRCDGKSSKITKPFTVGVGAVFTLAAGQACTLADVVANDGTIKSDGPALTITGTLRGNGKIVGENVEFDGDTACWHVECNDNGFTEKANLDDASENFLANLKALDVLSYGSKQVSAYVLESRKGLASVEGVALTVTAAETGLPLVASTLEIDGEDQLLLTVDRRDPRPTIAVWTGAAGNGDLEDPGNWACTNGVGKAVSGLPCEITDVHLNGETAIQIPAGAMFDVKSVVANMTLTNDCDWCGLAVPVSGKLDLKGHNLAVMQLNGNCEATDSNAAGLGGELHVNVPRGVTNVNSSATFTGSLTFVKDGEGTLTWAGGSIANTASVLITNGVLKLGVTTANVFGNSGTVAVKGKGQFDLNYDTHGGTSPVYNKTFEIEGDGPDGSGAIVNTAGNAKSNWGYTLKEVVLTGDATIGGKAYICFNGTAGAFGMKGPDHTLTIKNTSIVSICGGYLDVKRVVCSDGGLFQPADLAVAQAPEGVFLRSGGVFSPWSGAVDRELPLAVTVEAGETGFIRCDGKSSKITKPFTVGAGAVFTLAAGQACTLADVVANDGTIRSDGPVLTITGTLRGNGAITGANVAFGGDDSCWHVDIDGTGVRKVNLDNAPENFLANLKKIDVSYVQASGYYDLAPADDLTDEQLSQIALTVTNATTGREQTRSRLKIRNERLGVSISNGSRIIIR